MFKVNIKLKILNNSKVGFNATPSIIVGVSGSLYHKQIMNNSQVTTFKGPN